MKTMLNKAERLMLEHTVWIFFTVLMFYSTLFVQHSKPQTWLVYLTYLSMFCVMFSPVLVFSTFRNWLSEQLEKRQFWLIWLVVFVFYPFVFWICKSYEYFNFIFEYHEGVNEISVANRMIFIMIATSLFIIELVILSNDFIVEKTEIAHFFKKISIEWALFITMFLLTVFIVTLHHRNEYDYLFAWNHLDWFAKYIVQVFVVLGLYYTFYWLNHYLLINKILKKKGIVYYVFGFMAVLYFLFPIISQLIYFVPVVGEWEMHPVWTGEIFLDVNLVTPLIGMLLTIPFILAFQWYKQQNKITTLEKEKSETELNLLKQQINPHFFFNTLNNLYALSLKEDERTPEVILQLSDLMRYVIYKGREAEVRLEEDVQYIDDYIQLQQIRLHKFLDFKFEKSIENPNLRIPPLLFIILVENAFKHGIEGAENDCFLNISMVQKDNRLVFKCVNSFEDRNEKSGIGLDNLKQRLALLFPERYELKIEEKNNVFEVSLIIFTT